MPGETFFDGGVTLYSGDCLAVLADLAPESVDSVVTDPPYHLQSIVDRFSKTSLADDTETSARARSGADGLARNFRGFMGQTWDGGDIAFDPATWRAVARVLKPGGYLLAFSGTRTYHRMATAIEAAGFDVRDMLQWIYGTGFPKRREFLKPACEPICFARKPFPGTLADNLERNGTGAINIDACRIDGRYPANVVHDGSGEVIALFPDTTPAKTGRRNAPKEAGIYGAFDGEEADRYGHDDAGGSAARFFYSAKADDDDRLGSRHPTVKPVDLIRWLARLVTPPGGVVLDPFAGTGTAGEAAHREGMRAVLIEREAGYCDDIRRRMALVMAGPLARTAAKARRKTADPMPLFDGLTDE